MNERLKSGETPEESPMPADAPYISRPETEAFITDCQAAFKAPAQSPVVFHAWGIGGVGKSTLTRKVQESQAASTAIATVSFGLTEGIEEPIPLMAKLYQQIQPPDSWSADPFWEKYNLYFDTIHQLNTQAATAWGAVTPEQVGQVKSLLQLGVDIAGEWGLLDGKKKFASKLVDTGMNAAVAGLSLKDSLQQFLQQHRATKKDLALQKLMLEPLPQLTQAFVLGLARLAIKKPVMLVLDTYEKAPLIIDTWLWRTLLGNTDLARHPVRLVIAGRHCILRTEGWRKLEQDHQAVYERTIEKFTLEQTQKYLSEIALTETQEVESIYRVTKGLPYYLDWIRKQLQKGQPLDFSQGNHEIVRLLLQGLNDTQKRLVQLAACCRQFDGRVIRYLVEQRGLDFASAVDDSLNCFGWLTQQTFVEPIERSWRLDDVARDVFQQSLAQDELEEIHAWLASYIKALSEAEVDPDSSPAQRYNNDDWLLLRRGYLYHVMLAADPQAQNIWLSHLLEGRYLNKDEVIKAPFTAVVAEFDLANHPLLRSRNRQFLQRLQPVVEYGWALFEVDLIDYDLDKILGLTKAEIDQAIQLCLAQSEQFTGLARFVAFFFKARRCSSSQRLHYLQRAQTEAIAIAVPTDPEFSSKLFLWSLGNTFYEINQYKEALASYDKAIEYKPDKHEAWYNRGNVLDALGRKDEALSSYDKAIEYKPDLHEAWYNRGVVLSALGRKDEALSSYDKAIEYKSDDHEAWYNRGVVLSALGRKDEALSSYDKAIEYKPDKHEAWSNRGVVLSALGRKDEALASYDKAIEFKPDSASAFYNKACCYALLGEVDGALVCLEKALALNIEHYCSLTLKDTDFDSLRDDPRFQLLVQRLCGG